MDISLNCQTPHRLHSGIQPRKVRIPFDLALRTITPRLLPTSEKKWPTIGKGPHDHIIGLTPHPLPQSFHHLIDGRPIAKRTVSHEHCANITLPGKGRKIPGLSTRIVKIISFIQYPNELSLRAQRKLRRFNGKVEIFVIWSPGVPHVIDGPSIHTLQYSRENLVLAGANPCSE